MKNGKVLVVGGAGYIGSHMVKDLLDTGCDVITLDDLSTGHRELLPGGEFIEGGLGDTVLLDNLFSTHTMWANPWKSRLSTIATTWRQPQNFWIQ
jgi:UDP-glucose 4-epimerase